MHRPQVGLHVHVAAGVVDRPGGVQVPGQVVGVQVEPAVLPPGPARPARVSLNGVQAMIDGWLRSRTTISRHSPRKLRALSAVRRRDAPARRLAPGQVAQPVGPVVEALLEDLLVQPRAVEPGGHRELDVALERRVARRGPDAVGVEALVEHQAQVDRLVVEEDPVALDVDLAQPGVAAAPGRALARPVEHLELEVVEERDRRATRACAFANAAARRGAIGGGAISPRPTVAPLSSSVARKRSPGAS